MRYGKFKNKDEKGFFIDFYGYSSEWVMFKDCWAFGFYIQWIGLQIFFGPFSMNVQKIDG